MLDREEELRLLIKIQQILKSDIDLGEYLEFKIRDLRGY